MKINGSALGLAFEIFLCVEICPNNVSALIGTDFSHSPQLSLLSATIGLSVFFSEKVLNILSHAEPRTVTRM